MKGMNGGEDRRQNSRVALEQLILLGLYREEWVHARALDLSSTGFRFRSDREVAPGSELYVQFDLDGEQMVAWAIVVHEEQLPEGDYQTGCEFIRFYSDARVLLDEFLAVSRSR